MIVGRGLSSETDLFCLLRSRTIALGTKQCVSRHPLIATDQEHTMQLLFTQSLRKTLVIGLIKVKG
jgi:hypothetical protein